MTLALLSLPLSSPIPGLVKKKRVLLVDASPAKRELRVEALRKLGVDVDCACDISEARSWWRADLYDLVLVNPENELGRDKFCADVRETGNSRSLAFLVGKPEYISNLPTDPILKLATDQAISTSPAVEIAPEISQRWGIMEASQRISKVRSVSVAHTMAMRNRPTPPRDMEKRPSRRTDAESLMLAHFRGDEIQ